MVVSIKTYLVILNELILWTFKLTKRFYELQICSLKYVHKNEAKF